MEAPSTFQNPGPEYRIHPFWFWNGEMDEGQIARQIREMAEKGVGGFFICARQGLTVPYLSEAWFGKVRFAIEEAKKRSMHVWLYDEYPYPSGIAGGEVTLAHPDAKHYTLEQKTERVSGGTVLDLELPWARLLFAKAVPITANGERKWSEAIDVRPFIGNDQADPIFQKAGLTAYNQKRFFTYRTIYRLLWEVPKGDWEVVVFQEKEIDDFKYYGTFVDPCHREAMETFIRMTHDRYAEQFRDEFGGTVKGMFTDEIGLLGRMPWSPRLVGFIQEKNGYDLRERLHLLLDRGGSEEAARVRYDYYQAIHLLLRETYHKQVHDWCEKHGLQYVAEVPSVRRTTQLFSHVPGGDSAHEKLGRSLDWILRKYALNIRANPKMVSSLARQLGRERNLIECFHSVGWSMTLQDAKWMIDRMAALGTNFYNFHAFFYTLDGLAKHDAPPSQFLQNPYWKHFRQLGDYTGRISYLMTEGKADIQIALLDPTTTFWTHLGNPFHEFHYGGSDAAESLRLQRLKQDWEDMGVRLLKERRDFDYLDPELLAEAEVSNGTVRVGVAVYEVLLLPPMTNLEAGAWAKLRAFVREGGKLVGFGLLPHERIEDGAPSEEEALALFGLSQPTGDLYWKEADTESSNEGAAMVGSCTKGEGDVFFVPRSGSETVDAALDRLTALLDQVLPPSVHLELDAGSPSFLMQTRILSESTGAIFISNQEGESRQTRLRVDRGFLQDAKLVFAELDLETGEDGRLLASEAEGDGWLLPLAFAPYEARVIKVTKQIAAEPFVPADAKAKWDWQVDMAGPWALSADRPNTVRFEDFRLRIGEDREGFAVRAKTFIDQCSDVADEQAYRLKFKQMFGTPMKLSMSYPLTCTYTTAFVVDRLPASCRFGMDRSAISGVWTVSINGRPFSQEQLRHEFVYDHANVGCDVLPFLREGLNELTVTVQVEHDWDGVVDPLYLHGPFGVTFDELGRPVMTGEPSQTEALSAQPIDGYPYFAGTYSFKRNVFLSELPAATRFELQFTDWQTHDCVEVLVNGRSLGVRPWSPYRWAGEVSWLREGENELEIRLTVTLIGMLEGKRFDYDSHALLPVIATPE